jgi:hypothetical protein
LTATGTAPQVAAGGDATLNFIATIANASGSPDPSPGNDTPPIAQTVVKTVNVCNVVANAASISASAGAETTHINIIAGSGCPWTIQASAPFLTPTPASGSGDTTVALAIAANTTIAERSGNVAVGTQAIQIRQSGIPCTYALAPASVTLGAGAGSTTLAMTAPAGCAWDATASNPWLTVAPGSGTGSGTLTVNVQANPSTLARTASVSAANQVVPVAQAGMVEVAAAPAPQVDPCASLKLQREGDQVAQDGLTGGVGFGITVDVGCEWQASNSAPWLTVTGGGFGRGSGVVSYIVQPNFFTAARTGTIVVTAKGISKEFTVNQVGAPAQGGGGDSGGDGGGGGGGGVSGGGAG